MTLSTSLLLIKHEILSSSSSRISSRNVRTIVWSMGDKKKKPKGGKNGEKKKGGGGGKGKKGGRKGGRVKSSRCNIDIFTEAAMENAYTTCHNVQDLLYRRGFPWPEAQKKKKKGKK